ncbi:MAG: 50S ribosomal protein L11 methyltransferase [Anaerolineae bacterium]
MKWLEISVQADGEAAEAVCEVFNRYGQGGAVIEEVLAPNDEASTYLSPPLVRVKAFLPLDDAHEEGRQRLEEALWHLGQLYPIPPPQIRELAEEDWAEAWKRGYGVQRIGRRIVAVPSWQAYTPHAEDIVLRLDPGLAFGTGLHPTTRMCLVALEARLEPGARVLDVGTGSGILAIAAAKLSASQVLALDIDPLAVRIARENVRLNGVKDIVTVREGSLETGNLDLGTWDLILINILAETIIDLAGDLSTLLKPGGLLIAGGIIAEHEPAVVAGLRQANVTVVERLQDGDWVSLIGVRGPGH